MSHAEEPIYHPGARIAHPELGAGVVLETLDGGLDFEVFGSEGDITDRKTNAFAKHDRLIASIDTLKRPARIKRLLEAPRWDLVVFDEAHHLTANRSGGRCGRCLMGWAICGV